MITCAPIACRQEKHCFHDDLSKNIKYVGKTNVHVFQNGKTLIISYKKAIRSLANAVCSQKNPINHGKNMIKSPVLYLYAGTNLTDRPTTILKIN